MLVRWSSNAEVIRCDRENRRKNQGDVRAAGPVAPGGARGMRIARKTQRIAFARTKGDFFLSSLPSFTTHVAGTFTMRGLPETVGCLHCIPRSVAANETHICARITKDFTHFATNIAGASL
jgi:hypothetical protein